MALAKRDKAAVVHSTGEIHADERAHISDLGNRLHKNLKTKTEACEACWPRRWPEDKEA